MCFKKRHKPRKPGSISIPPWMGPKCTYAELSYPMPREEISWEVTREVPKPRYEITDIDRGSRRIFLRYDRAAEYGVLYGFAELVKRICDACGGTLRETEYSHYKIDGDRYDLTYQYDDAQGIIVHCGPEDPLDGIPQYLETFL